ncbi:hypothetical protein AAFF_G00113140 [Aldrovandia affinis]|uniref:Uncharacterized protein n=1 Tax=Aldrovandia affinis TaxID=143900 RepID=A0AAD7RTF1_9TELE|nr:hypothetical protein AAFF_G00113140 [Aldrovandia affinis]
MNPRCTATSKRDGGPLFPCRLSTLLTPWRARVFLRLVCATACLVATCPRQLAPCLRTLLHLLAESVKSPNGLSASQQSTGTRWCRILNTILPRPNPETISPSPQRHRTSAPSTSYRALGALIVNGRSRLTGSVPRAPKNSRPLLVSCAALLRRLQSRLTRFVS